MSVVTDVVLLLSLAETWIEEDENAEEMSIEVESEALNKVNAWLQQHGYGRLVILDDYASEVGNKAFQASLCTGAFNYLDEAAFREMVFSQSWRSPENVQLLMKGEFDERFTLYDVQSAELNES